MEEETRIQRREEESLCSQRQQLKLKGMAKEIADTFSYSPSEVEQILRAEMHSLDQGARIKQFVLLLAGKRVKDWLTLNRRPLDRAI